MDKICLEESEESSETDKVDYSTRKIILSNCVVFFDFDNTITRFDVIDDIVERFSINEKWRKIEEDWKQGKIGSKECLERQFNEVRIKKDALINYLSTIEIDEYFPKILALIKRSKASLAIASDSCSFIIDNILKNNGIKGIKVYSNKLKFNKDRIILDFPYFNKNCSKCANCKKSHLQKAAGRDKIFIYVGDGLSDVCAAGFADIVFAKASLLEHFKKEKKEYIEFDTLAVVYNYLKEITQ